MTSRLLMIAFVLAICDRGACHIILDDEITSTGPPPCVRNIAERHFVREGDIIVVSDGPNDRVMDFQGMVLVIVNSMEAHELIRSTGPRRGIMLLEGNFKRDLLLLKALDKFHARSRLIIVINGVETSVSGRREYLTKVFRHLDENNNGILVVVAVESKSGSVVLYRHVGRIHKNCRGDTVKKIGNCSTKRIDGLFSWKINYQRCPLKLGTYKSPLALYGDKNVRKNYHDIGSSIVDVIVDRLNATQQILRRSDGLREMVENDEVELAWSLAMVSPKHSAYHTHSYVFDKGVVAYHEKRSIGFRYWLTSTFTPLGNKVWIGVGLVVLLHLILKRLTGGFGEISFLNLVAVCLGIAYPRTPTRLSSRIFYGSWIIFGYVLAQCYLANLAMTFITTNGKPEFATMDDLEKSKLRFGGLADMRSVFEEKWPRLHREFQIMNLSEYRNYAKEIENGKSDLALYVRYYWSNVRSSTNVSTVPEVITWYPIGMLLNKASLIGPTCNHVIDALVESGIIQHLIMGSYRSPKSPAKVKESNDAFNFNDFLVIFLRVYVVGCVCACIVFLIELCVSFYFRKMGSRVIRLN